jgi:glucan phosphorylase
MFLALYNHSKRKNQSVANAMTSENWIRDLMHKLTQAFSSNIYSSWMLIEELPYNANDSRDDS